MYDVAVLFPRIIASESAHKVISHLLLVVLAFVMIAYLEDNLLLVSATRWLG